VILSTHIVSDAEAAATEVAVISHGRLLRFAVPEALLQAVEGRVWQWVIPSAELNAARQQHLVCSTVKRADGVHVRVVADSAPSSTAVSVVPMLEDAYLYLLAHAEVAIGAAGP